MTDKPIKLILIYVCVFFIFSSCNQNNTHDLNNELQDGSTIGNLEGKWFFQPLDKKLALSLAGTKTIVSVNFIDSVYCNIEINSISGNVSLSRKYKLDNNNLTFQDPTSDKNSLYMISNINDVDQSFCISNKENIKLFKVIAYNSKVRSLMNSENILQKNEFLYPTIDPKEREYGTDQLVEEKNGNLNIRQSKNRAELFKINIYKLF